jgi:hypothetical protein
MEIGVDESRAEHSPFAIERFDAADEEGAA